MKYLIPREKKFKLLLFISVVCVFFMEPTHIQGSWRSDGPYGGYVYSLAMVKTNPDIIYAGTELGVFKTLDDGGSWTLTAFPENYVRVVQVAADNPDIVYAASDTGIYKSEDGGEIWTRQNGGTGILSGARVNAIAIDPQNHEVVYVGTGRKLQQPSEEITGIFKSSDGGENWEEIYIGGLDAVAAIIIDDEEPLHIYAGVYPWGSSSEGFLKSTDGGETWISKDIDPPYTADEVVALAMTSAGLTPPLIYAIGGSYVYKSPDLGESWTRTNYNYHSPIVLAVDATDPDVIYTGTSRWRITWPSDQIYSHSEFYKSTDGGDTWFQKDDGFLPEGAVTSIVVHPRNSTVYVGLSAGGVYRSTDFAESWMISSQGMQTYIYGLAIDPDSSVRVFAALWGEGHHLARTSDGGISWDYMIGSKTPTNLGAVAIDPQNSDVLFAGDAYRYYASLYIHKTTDGGQNWEPTELFYVSNYSRVYDIWISPNDSKNILAAVGDWSNTYGGVYKSGDGGTTFQRTNSFWQVSTLASDPNYPDTLYCGTYDYGYVFQSTDGGDSWTLISPNDIWVQRIEDLEVDLNSHVYAATNEGLQKWDGTIWTKLSGLPTDDITALAIDKATSPGTVYVGTGMDGVFVSYDQGNTWEPFNDGLENRAITKLDISATTPKKIYAGTAYAGVWSIPIDGIAVTYNFTSGGWYIISLPVVPPDATVSALFPTALNVYEWKADQSSYEIVTELEPKKGYWLAIPEATTVEVRGTPLYNYTESFHQGWYLIGSVLGGADFTNPSDIPDGMVLTPAYGWTSPHGSYDSTTTLKENEGYWIAIFGDCELTLGGGNGGATLVKSCAEQNKDWETFASLYGELPPSPPQIDWDTGDIVKLPKYFALRQNYPNPFNQSTVVEFDVPENSFVKLQIFNLRGQLIRTLIDKNMVAGSHHIVWNGKDNSNQDLPSGLYIFRIIAGVFTANMKSILVR